MRDGCSKVLRVLELGSDLKPAPVSIHTSANTQLPKYLLSAQVVILDWNYGTVLCTSSYGGTPQTWPHTTYQVVPSNWETIFY